jgi:hypothetical protein
VCLYLALTFCFRGVVVFCFSILDYHFVSVEQFADFDW